MQPVGRGRSGLIERAVLNHGKRAAQAFLGRLENQLDPSWQLVAVARQQLCDTHADRSMAVVSAGVHHTGVFRSEGQSGLLVNRKCVHIKPQHDGLAVGLRLIRFHHCDYAGLADAGAHFEPQFLQMRGDYASCAHFLEPQLGVTMEISPPFYELGKQFVGFSLDPLLHDNLSSLA